jgi:hypothetical protein
MHLNFSKTLFAAAVVAVAFSMSARAQDAKEPLNIVLPPPTSKGTPEDLPKGPHIEPPSDKAPAALMVPKGVKNLALGKPVTTSVAPYVGDPNQITDGKKDPSDDDSIEFKKGSQWIQVDLGETCAVYAVAMWHDHRYVQLMHDVIVQISDDKEFKNGVTTVFNNDTDNTSGAGVGTDREYFEMKWGKVADAKGAKGRYVRSYTRGGSLSAANCWQEIEVYGLPAK